MSPRAVDLDGAALERAESNVVELRVLDDGHVAAIEDECERLPGPLEAGADREVEMPTPQSLAQLQALGASHVVEFHGDLWVAVDQAQVVVCGASMSDEREGACVCH